MSEQDQPVVVNIRYRDEIQNRLEQQGAIKAKRIALVVAAFAVVLSICWHYLR